MRIAAAVLATAFLLLASVSAQEAPNHHFFDNENITLWSGVSIARAMDCDSTWKLLDHSWGQEYILPTSIARSRAQMTLFSVGMVGAQIGGSYLLHRMGWHHAEHWTSAVHATLVGATAIHNYGIN